jgi:hypothetical protein
MWYHIDEEDGDRKECASDFAESVVNVLDVEELGRWDSEDNPGGEFEWGCPRNCAVGSG